MKEYNLKEYNFIKERREELGITQRELAKEIGMAQSTYSRFENTDFKEIRVCDLEAILRVLYEREAYFTLTDVDVDVLYVMGNHITERVEFNISVNKEKYNINYEEINKELRAENDEFLKIISDLKEENNKLRQAVKSVASIIN